MARSSTARAAPRSAPARPRAPARRKSGRAAPAKRSPSAKPRAAAKPRTAVKTRGRTAPASVKTRGAPAVRARTAPRQPSRARPLAAVAVLPLKVVRGAHSSPLLDRLLRGRAWVVCVGALLAGIVFLNVSLLERGSGITSTSERVTALKRENAALRQRVSRLGGSERIQELAQQRGMILPAPGDVRYLKLDPANDSRRAVRRMSATEETAAIVPAPAPPPAEASAPPAPAEPAPAATQPAPAAPSPQAAAPAPTTTPQGY